jgi:hypothetical protein
MSTCEARLIERREIQQRERLAILSFEWHRLLPASEDRLLLSQMLADLYSRLPLPITCGASP